MVAVRLREYNTVLINKVRFVLAESFRRLVRSMEADVNWWPNCLTHRRVRQDITRPYRGAEDTKERLGRFA